MDQEWFSPALGLVPPWMVDRVTFTVEDQRLDLYLNFPKECPTRSIPMILRFFGHMVGIGQEGFCRSVDDAGEEQTEAGQQNRRCVVPGVFWIVCGECDS
ncbi:MAG: hypothetical protein ACYCZC_05020 [Acidithiobacillus sp.]